MAVTSYKQVVHRLKKTISLVWCDNYLIKIVDKKLDLEIFEENYYKILQLMFPVVPHFASECINDLNKQLNYKWPKADKKYLTEDKVNIVIQINGKKRGIFEIDKGTDEKSILDKINKLNTIEKYLNNKKIEKTILIKDRLINSVILEKFFGFKEVLWSGPFKLLFRVKCFSITQAPLETAKAGV